MAGLSITCHKEQKEVDMEGVVITKGEGEEVEKL